MKTLKQALTITGLAVLLAGCATNDHQNSGAMGNNPEVGTGTQSSNPQMGANGSVGPGNPFGAGPGTGLSN